MIGIAFCFGDIFESRVLQQASCFVKVSEAEFVSSHLDDDLKIVNWRGSETTAGNCHGFSSDSSQTFDYRTSALLNFP